MPRIQIEGYTPEEILALPKEWLDAYALNGEPFVFTAGTANILAKFHATADTLILEIGHIDGGGDGALPAVASLASRYAKREHLKFIEWRVHAVNCARPNLKLRQMLERKGFIVRALPDTGECYWLRVAIQNSLHAPQKNSKQNSAEASFEPGDSINLISPYRYDGVWVFDDMRVGLSKEPFVSGADVLIDRMVANIPDAEHGFALLFSASNFPGHEFQLEWRRQDGGGNWFYSPQFDMEGWLCPALFKYFPYTPNMLYVQVKKKSEAYT